jgi:hypothetical protein
MKKTASFVFWGFLRILSIAPFFMAGISCKPPTVPAPHSSATVLKNSKVESPSLSTSELEKQSNINFKKWQYENIKSFNEKAEQWKYNIDHINGHLSGLIDHENHKISIVLIDRRINEMDADIDDCFINQNTAYKKINHLPMRDLAKVIADDMKKPWIIELLYMKDQKNWPVFFSVKGK